MEKLKYLWHKFLYVVGIMVIIFAVYGAYHEQYGFEIPEANYISACDGKEVVSSIKTQCTKMDGVRNDRPIYAEIITDVYSIRDVYKTTVYRRFCFPQGGRSVQFVLREFIQDANNGDKQRVEVGADLDLEETNCASIEALFWDVDGKARDGVLYYRMTENGVEDYE